MLNGLPAARYHLQGGLIGLLLVVAILVIFLPVKEHAFINFDDDKLITENPHIQEGLTWKGLKWALSADFASDDANADYWVPLTFISHLLAVEFFGMNPSAHHLINVVIHILNALLIFLFFRWITGTIWKSAFVAALFAIHPLHVESVAWVSERKDVLSTLFFVLALFSYVRYTQHPKVGRYLVTVLLFAIGLTAKPMLVMFPLVLLLLDYWPLNRLFTEKPKIENPSRLFGWLVLEKLPFFLIAAISGLITSFAVQRAGTLASFDLAPISMRVSNALFSYMSYMGKMFWPSQLAVFYPYPKDLPILGVASSVLLLVGISFLSIRWIRTRPYLFVGWTWYLVTLLPVIGLLQTGQQAMADRYTYIPLIGLFIVLAWGVPDTMTGRRYRKAVLPTVAVILILSLMARAGNQVVHWHNSITLFENAIRVTRNNYLAHNNLGVAYRELGDTNRALQEFSTAIELRPGYAFAHHNLGIAYRISGRLQESLAKIETAIRLNPNFAKAYYNLGIVLNDMGRFDEAVSAFLSAIRIQPGFAKAHVNLGYIYEHLGRLDPAIAAYQTGIKLDRKDGLAHNNLANALFKQGQFQEAFEAYHSAIKLQPDSATPRVDLGTALAQRGQLDQAIRELEAAIRLDHSNTKAYYNAGLIYEKKGQWIKAKRHYEQVLQINPDDPAARKALVSMGE